MNNSSLPRVLQMGRLPLPALETDLAVQYNVTCLTDQADPAAFLAAEGAQFSGVVTAASIGLKSEVIAALPNLQVISSFSLALFLFIATAGKRCTSVRLRQDNSIAHLSS